MGYLRHDTANIIVDAVLTDYGRRLLSMNDGSFNIHSFALFDDEVDYSIIEKYGKNVGIEKISKNTPVLEALTNGSVALKNPCLSLPNQYITHMPSISITSTVIGQKGSATSVTLSRSVTSSTRNFVLTLEQELTGQQFVPLGLTDYFFKIELDDKFLQIRNFVPDEILENQVAVYTIPSNKNTKQGRSSRQLTIDLKTFSNDMFNTYKVSGTSQINTYITVTGINSGARTIFPVTISNA